MIKPARSGAVASPGPFTPEIRVNLSPGWKRRIYQDLAKQVERGGYRGWVVAFSLGGVAG